VQGVINAVDGPARHRWSSRWSAPRLPNAGGAQFEPRHDPCILGPAIAGVVIAFAGTGVCFAVNSASFLAILVVLLALDTSKMTKPAGDASATLFGGARDALRFVRRSRRAGTAFVVVFVLATFSFNFNVLLPLVADRTLHRGAQTFGLIAAVFGAGALCGALINATHGVASLRRLLIGAIGFGAGELALAPQHSLYIVCALLFAIGIFYTLWGTNALSVLQLEAPAHLRGRAASLYFFAFLGGAPLGGLFAGWLTAVGGTELAFLIGGTVSLGWRCSRSGSAADQRGGALDVVVADPAMGDESNAPATGCEREDPALLELRQRGCGQFRHHEIRRRGLEGEERSELARAVVVLCDSLDEAECDEAGRCKDPLLVHGAAAELTQPPARFGDHGMLAGEQRAVGGAQSLGQAERDKSTGAARLRHRH
jgi:hypothetical protein